MLERLLEHTSRTFALSIPLLPEPAMQQIMVSYLLFRIADTFEDEAGWSNAERIAALEGFGALLRRLDRSCGTDGEGSRNDWCLDRVDVADAAYAELLRSADEVLGALARFDARARRTIIAHLQRTIGGMRLWLERDTLPSTVEEVKEYCYYVAGIVGELCSELFILHEPALERARGELLALAPHFGEGLQLVNILRDELDDEHDGRHYLPRTPARRDLFDVAAEDLRRAGEYVALLEECGAPPGVVAFNAMNLRLAIETLSRVRELGPGVKLTRQEVAVAFEAIAGAAARREPISPLITPSPVR